jgi:hypothetical protein
LPRGGGSGTPRRARKRVQGSGRSCPGLLPRLGHDRQSVGLGEGVGGGGPLLAGGMRLQRPMPSRPSNTQVAVDAVSSTAPPATGPRAAPGGVSNIQIPCKCRLTANGSGSWLPRLVRWPSPRPSQKKHPHPLTCPHTHPPCHLPPPSPLTATHPGSVHLPWASHPLPPGSLPTSLLRTCQPTALLSSLWQCTPPGNKRSMKSVITAVGFQLRSRPTPRRGPRPTQSTVHQTMG